MLEHAQPTADEVRALANKLMSWADRLSALPAPLPPDDLTRPQLLAVATAAREVRRQRTVTFPHLRLREPMWDVMLDLFIEPERGYRVSLDHLSLNGELDAAVVNHAVAVLVTAGLVERTPDRFDKRVVWLTLSPAGQAGMIEHFTQAAGHLRPCAPRTVSTARAAAWRCSPRRGFRQRHVSSASARSASKSPATERYSSRTTSVIPCGVSAGER